VSTTPEPGYLSFSDLELIFFSSREPRSQGVAMQSRSAGATASFKFNGTGCGIYGPLGTPGGPYTVSVNGTQVKQGTSQGPAQGGVAKYSVENLPLGLHDVVFTNTDNDRSQTLDWVGLLMYDFAGLN
jgi:hypothetical protein